MVLAVLLAVFAGRQCEQKGYSYHLGFWLCFIASPIVALLVNACLPNQSRPNRVSPELQLEIELELARLKANQTAAG
jgi:hypothetical protein